MEERSSCAASASASALLLLLALVSSPQRGRRRIYSRAPATTRAVRTRQVVGATQCLCVRWCSQPARARGWPPRSTAHSCHARLARAVGLGPLRLWPRARGAGRCLWRPSWGSGDRGAAHTRTRTEVTCGGPGKFVLLP